MRVVFTPLAERQLDALHHYISTNSGEARADSYINRIVGFCESLRMFPLRGAARDDLLPGLRTIGFARRATIAFVVAPEVIIIEGVFYGGQDYEAVFD